MSGRRIRCGGMPLLLTEGQYQAIKPYMAELHVEDLGPCDPLVDPDVVRQNEEDLKRIMAYFEEPS